MATKGSGKTTIAEFLVKNYGFVEKSFADPLKRICKELFILDDYQIYGTQEQKEIPDTRWYDCTPRKMLQYVGTELLRENLDNIMPGLGKNIFTHHFKLWYDAEIKKNPNLRVVISDVRFQNEVDFIQSLEGFVIKLDRQSVQTDDMHPSERELQQIKTYDHLINNNGTLNDLYQKIEEFMLTKFDIQSRKIIYDNTFYGDHNDQLIYGFNRVC